MRKVVVLHPRINYAIVHRMNPGIQVAWFIDEDDAWDFFKIMSGIDYYEIAEVR